MAIRFVPDKFKTNELCKLAVYNNGETIKNIGVQFKTQELCHIAVKNNGKAIIGVPKKFITTELCELAVMNAPKDFFDIFSLIPTEFHTESLYTKAIKWDKIRLPKIPKNFLSQEICEILMQRDQRQYDFIPEEFRSLKIQKMAENRRMIYDIDLDFISNLLKKYLKETKPDVIVELDKEAR